MTILTAGYGNLGFERFMERMHEHGVTHLVDVRSIPYSRYHEAFRKENLIDLVPAEGFKYVWMGDTLGGVQGSAAACKDPGAVDWEAMRQSERLALGLDKLIEAASVEGRKLCLMCGCLRPQKCHRGKLLSPALLDRGVEVLHVADDGSLIPHDRIIVEIDCGQASLF